MTPLRRELQQGREEYRGARYPGDLAGELLPPMRSRYWRIVGVIAAGSAIAAAIVVWVSLHAAMERVHRNQIAIKPTSTTVVTDDVGFATPSLGMTPTATDVSDVSVASAPVMPAMELALPSMDLSMPEMPSMPAME